MSGVMFIFIMVHRCCRQMYYRQKGNRPVTRPEAMQETFEVCAELLAEKLQSYYTQADDYRNQCLLGK